MTGQEQVWFPDDQQGYSIAICECEDGAYLGARRMGTPCVCERCKRLTRDQWDFLVAAVLAEARRHALRSQSGGPWACTGCEWTLRGTFAEAETKHEEHRFSPPMLRTSA